MMPGVSRGEMNGGYNEFEHGHLRSSSYANGYDPYRKGREEFRDGPRRHNGIDDLDQNSFEMRESRDPTFEVDHLATYTSKSGVTHPEDGLTKLKQMESSTGIWTMRCSLIIERYHIVVIDKGNGDELERFPMANVHEPTAVLKNDRRETYNNLLLFSIIDDPRRKNSPSDMHIFQSINVPAHDLVDEILTAKGETARSRDPPDQRIPPPPRVPAPEPPYYGKSDIHTSLRESQGPGYGAEPPLESRLQETRLDGSRIDSSRRFTDGRSTGAFIGGGGLSATRVGYSYRDDMDTGQNEAMERDVQLLNNCFDDIEKFVSRLQQAAEAYKELERRRDQRGGKKNKKPFSGDGMLSMRARPPPAEDFVDIFQKFKFAFNLLAKLRAHIHTPNAPELVHFLFTPLSLIYEASRDPIHGGRDLSGEAVAPLLLYEAKQLLTNCLTSKEMELWQRLGRAWNLTKEDWSGHVPPYHPRFYNGWAPSPQLVDDIIMPERLPYREEPLRATQERPGRYVESRREEEPFPRSSRREDYGSSRREDPYIRREEPPIMSSRREDPYVRREEPPIMSSRREDPYVVREDPYVSRREDPYTRDIRGSARDEIRPPSPAPYRSEEKRNSSNAPKSRAEENIAFAQELRRMGATIYEAGHERKGKNAKELNVEKGDIVQVLDKSRNWWKLKNYRGETGYAPYTILKEYQTGDEYDNGFVLPRTLQLGM